ncbi:MAG: nuclear transport factor 2 family protein [Saprospiraceae bacterium]
MKIILLLFALTVSIHTLTFGQQQKANISDSTLIIQFENDWAKALMNRDETIFNKMLAADFFYTENEKLYTRVEVIQSVMSVSDTIESAYNEDMQVHIKDKTAIVTGWLFVNGRSNTGSFKRKYRFTDIWYNQKGSWKLIAAQDYLLP